MNIFATFFSSRRSAIQWASCLSLVAAAVLVADYQPPVEQGPPTDYPPTTAMVDPIDLMLS